MESFLSFVNFLITISIIMTTYYFLSFYSSLKNYPPGPLPWPILGNILMLKGTTISPTESFMLMRKKYGDKLFTFWIGNWPCVFIFDYQLAKEAFNKGIFSGRPQTLIAEIVLKDNSDVILSNFTPTWESLRKVAYNAARKFAINEKLPTLISDIVDEIIDMIKHEEDGRPFKAKHYVNLILQNCISSIAFGKKYDIRDEEFKILISFQDRVGKFGEKLAIVDLMPFMRYPFGNALSEFRKYSNDIISLIKSKYNQHLLTYQEGIIRDFADALIASKNDAIKDAKINMRNSIATHLNDENLSSTLWNLFIAGTETSTCTLEWSILLMANYLDIQSRLREEIAIQIGNRIPTQDDKNLCHYVCAFINEVLRFRNVGPIGLPHMILEDTTIGGHKIAKGCFVCCVQYSILNDEQYWDDPDVFNPERFLDLDGKICATKNPAFIPFGIGRRICPGEKLAIADLFLIIVRILQQTEGFQLMLSDGESHADLAPNPHQIPTLCSPKSYKIILRRL